MNNEQVKNDISLSETETTKRSLLLKNKPLVHAKCLKFNEKLAKGESIAIIQFQYNYICNFACKHCSILRFQPKFPDKRKFTLYDVRKLAKEADELGLARFVITGGEPLIFKDFDDIVEAINPQKFYINVDTNGWFLDKNKAKHLKEIGVDRIQLSLDSFNAKDHDDFRQKPGSYDRAIKAIDISLDAGLEIFIQTVVTKQRLYSSEFLNFIEFFGKKGINVFVTYAKPVGAWEGNMDVLVDRADMNYFREMEKKYNICTHLTPAYGRDLGCIAVKGMISVTEYGDVLPCPYIHVSIGNVFKEPLKDIIDRGMNIKFFGEYVDTCLIAEDRKFIDDYIVKKVYGKPLPVESSDVFSDSDKTKIPFNETMKNLHKI